MREEEIELRELQQKKKGKKKKKKWHLGALNPLAPTP
jgi:hypothetical protein